MDLQASLSTWFPRQEYWSGLPFPSLGSLPDPGIKPTSPVSSPWQEGSLPLSHLGSPIPDYYGSTKLEYFGWMGSSENFLDVDQDCVSVEETVRECWWSRNSRHHVEGKVKKTKCHKWKAFEREASCIFVTSSIWLTWNRLPDISTAQIGLFGILLGSSVFKWHETFFF